ncbi:hypothetical protein GALMADRAFT_901100 [Galerina marginata CBS 339.88]|uniref:FAS1 domain-containing protein n=1 Tax=Galerina marginata (strain CBS 339.88) TaxID=685588 RepID=A0A067SJ43_GALM3|nr:hypothetical protein GALMADRAFT_901100 [Galerina marginata CBS 339.88]
MQLRNIFLLGFAATALAQSIVDVLKGQSQLSTLVTLLNTQPDLVSTLGSATNITLLAPHNDAFTQFLNSPAGMQAATTPGAVAALLTYHVIKGTFPASAFTSTPVFVSTLLTNTSFTNVTGGQVVEGVAPQGGGVNIFSGLKSKSSVTTPNIAFTGGIIHVIDNVLTIPPTVSVTAAANNLTQLASAVTSTGLLSAVDTTPNITVFAPTNDAFSAISNVVKGLSNAQLSSILQYHVVPALGYSSLLSNTSLPTLEGQKVNIALSGGNVNVNTALVTVADVIVANGVVHVINSVLSLPNGSSSSPSSGSSAGSAIALSPRIVKGAAFGALLSTISLML